MPTGEDRHGEDYERADSLLVQQVLLGDQDAFEALVNRYKKSLAGLILRYVGEYHEVEDILQQVWLQLYLSLATLRPDVQIKPWLFTVARNRSLDYLRHKNLLSKRVLFFCELETRIEEDGVTLLDAIPDTTSTPEDQAELHDLQREIQLAIQSLPHTYCPVVWHFYIDQLNYAEIGRILGVRGSTVKTRFNRAKPILRDVIIAP
jgi:RNA polymerase sigma-70 factor, ECF subfamily